MRWSLRQAKQKLETLVRRAQDSPQMITEDGETKVVLVSVEHYRALTEKEKPDTETADSLVALLQTSPHRDVDLTPERSKDTGRDVALE